MEEQETKIVGFSWLQEQPSYLFEVTGSYIEIFETLQKKPSQTKIKFD